MRKKASRLLAMVLVISMLSTTLPIPGFARQSESETGETGIQTIDLPLIEEGEEAPPPQGDNGDVATLSLTPYDENTSYSYVGRSTIQIKDTYILDPETRNKIIEKPETNGILQILDENGNVMAYSDAITYYYIDSPDGYIYLRNTYLRNTSAVPEGSYSLQLAAGNTIYPCTGSVQVVGEGNLLVTHVGVSNFYAGESTFDVSASLYGFDSEEDLANLSFILKEKDTDFEIGRSTSAYRDLETYYQDGMWRVYAQMVMEDDLTIVNRSECYLQISYSGDKNLIDDVGAATIYGELPNTQVNDFRILDGQKALVEVDLKYLTPGSTYRVTVSDSATVCAEWTGTFQESTGSIELQLSSNGAILPVSSYGYGFNVSVYKDNVLQDSSSFTNPYKNTQQEYLYFYPRHLNPDVEELEFTLSFMGGCSAFTGVNDVLTMESTAGDEVGRCDSLTLYQSGSSGTITGTLRISTALSDGKRYTIYLNGVEVDTVLVTSQLMSLSNVACADVRESFWMNFGEFPLEADIINTSGTGQFVFRAGDTDVLSSSSITGTASEYDGYLLYQYCFTAKEFQALTPGAQYTLVFRDIDGREGSIWSTPLPYNATNTGFHPEVLSWSWYKLKAGSQEIEANLYDMETSRNLTLEDLEALKDITLSNGSEVFSVESYSGDWAETYSSYDLTLTLDKPVTAGTYTAYYNGEILRSNINITSPTVENPGISSGSARDGYVRGSHLPVNGVYTGKIYKGYTCMTPEAFPMTLQGAEDEDQYLYFDKGILADYEAGNYQLRVYCGTTLLGAADLVLENETSPILIFEDTDDDWEDKGDPVFHQPTFLFRVVNQGAYGYIRWGETEAKLEQSSFQRYSASNYFSHWLTGEDGQKTLFVEFSKTGQAGDQDNLIYDLDLWLCTDGDYDVQVPEDIQGIKNLDQEGSYTITATTEIPATRLWVTFEEPNGNYARQQMTYVGLTEEGRYEFSLTFDLSDYVSESGRTVYYKNISMIQIFSTDLSNKSNQNESYKGNIVGQPVERVLIFGDPTSIILPEFHNSMLLTNQTSYTLYGYTVPGSNVTISEGGEVLATGSSDDTGYFSILVSDLSDGEHTFIVSDDSDATDDCTAYLKVDATAPVIDSVGFTFLDGGAAVVRWACDDGDVAYFQVYKNNVLLGRVSADSFSYNVTASADDGNTFTIKAVDIAGNIGEKTVTTADQEPPTAPSDLQVAQKTTTSITLSWTAGTDNMGVAGYNIYAGEQLVARTEGESTQYTLSALAMGMEYAFTVKTRDRAGNLSDGGAELTASTVGLTMTAEVEENYIADEFSNKQISIPVMVTPDLEGYSLVLARILVEYRSVNDASGDWHSTTELVGNDWTGTWDISGDDDGYLTMGQYQLRLTAIDSCGAQVSTAVTTVTLKRDDQPPTTPGIPTASSHSTTTITFTWDASEDNVGVNHYEIYRDGGKVGESPDSTYTDTGLEMGQSYSYTVKAVDARGNTSALSDAASLSTMELAFDSVIELDDSYVMEAQGEKKIVVWAKFRPVDGYDPDVTMTMEYQTTGSQSWSSVPLTVSAADGNLFDGYWDISGDDTGYLPVGSYSVRFAVTDGNATAYSETQSVELTRDAVSPEVVSISPDGETMGGRKITIRVHATDNVGVERVVLYYARQGAENFTEIGEAVADASSQWFDYDWNASGLTSGTYTIKVEAYDSRNNMGSKTAAVTIDNTPPQVPGYFTVTGTSRYIHVMWDEEYSAPSDFACFNIYRAESENGTFMKVKSTNSIGYFDDGESAQAGTVYYYYVTAQDTYGNESGPTAVRSAMLVADNSSPIIDDLLPRENATLQKSTVIQVAATDNYRLAKAVFSYRRANTQDDWTEIGSQTVQEVTNNTIFDCTWDVSELSGDYEIKVEVYDDSINDVEENSGYEANDPAVITGTVTVQPYSLPVAPVVTVEAGYKTASLSWSYGGDQDTLSWFNIYQIRGTQRHYVTSISAEGTGCTVDIQNTGTYTFVVVARDKYGETAESNQVNVTSLEREDEPPVAVILPETLTAAAGVPFTFSGAGSTDNDRIASYNWEFGDDTTGSGRTCQHTYEQAGTYNVKLTVTDDSGNQGTKTAQIVVYDVVDENADHALLTVTVVNGYGEGTPALAGAQVKIYSNGFESSAVTNGEGKAVLVVPLGEHTLSVIESGYISTSRKITVIADENGASTYTVGLRPVSISTLDGSLSVEELTYDEILAAGIDVTDPDNSQVWKFETTLTFVAGAELPVELPITIYQNLAGELVESRGCGWNTIGGGAGGGSGISVGLFPISEKFVLVIYGEAHWLKEMYNVELLAINNSYTDDITDCVATLELPEGLSLAAMTGEAQSERIELGTIAHKTGENDTANVAKATWYIRGDAEGEYNLTATVTGNAPDPFLNTFTTSDPVKVYAGSALKLFITAEDIAYRGEEYHVQFKLQNVSEKDLYNLSFGITGAEQFKVIQSDNGEGRLELTQDDFENGMTQTIDVLKPGGSITIDFYTTTWFNSILELADLGPFDVGYHLTNVFVTTLEGSTTTIPYEVEITHVSHGTFFEWLWGETEEALEGETVDLLDKTFFDDVPIVGTGLKVYKFLAEDSGDTNSKAIITVENGYVTASNNFLRMLASPQGAISIYTDAPEENYQICPDGKTLTITGDATIYVQGETAGEATMTVTTYADGQPNEYTMVYTVSGEIGEAGEVILQAPQQSSAAVPLAGETLQVTFPYALRDDQGNLMADASNAEWTVLGPDTTGLTIDKGVLTVDSTAQGGTYTIRLSLDTDVYKEQTITLTREESEATSLKLYRESQEIVESDTLVIPVNDVTENHMYTAKLLDQYGMEMEGEIVWTAANNTSSAVCQDGTISLTKDTSAGTLTLTASAGETTVSVTITITNLSVDWSDVEEAFRSTSYIYGDPNNKVSLPQTGTATAIETVEGTFSVADGEAIQDAGERTITVNFTAGEGTYAGTVISKEFSIQIGKKPLEEDMITVTGSYTYTGSPVTPTYSVADGSLLHEDDYTVEYADNTDVGTATVTVTGQGNYTGTISKTFTIEPKLLTNDMMQEISGELIYDGQAHTPEITLEYGEITLVNGTDYTVSYVDNINAGMATVTVTGQGNYTGTISGRFTIAARILTDGMVQPITGQLIYNGQAHTPAVTVMDGETTLVKDRDYSVSYDSNIDAGTASVTITGQGNYAGTAHASFAITKASMNELTPTLTGTGQVGNVLVAKLEGVEAGQYTWHWYYKTDEAPGYVEIADALGKDFYVITWAESNKDIYVEAAALHEGNYEGTTMSSLPVQIARQTIAGNVTISASEETIQSGGILTAIVQISPDVDVTFQWKLDGQIVDGATEATFAVPADCAGKLISLTVTPVSNDFAGSITSTAVMVGKAALTGTLTLRREDSTITAIAEGFAEDSFDIVWLRNGVVISGASGDTYAVTDTDKGTDISAKAVAKGDYTGEILAESIPIAPTAPDAPAVTASAGNSSVNVSWTVSHYGGMAVTGYTLTVKDGETIVKTVELDGLTLSCTVDGLTNGIAYTFEVTATNGVGTSAAGMATATPRASGGGSAGGSMGGSISQDQETVTNPDGSTTTTVTNPDGSTTATTQAPNGASSVVNTDRNGLVQAEVTIPATVVDDAVAQGQAVALPMPAVDASSNVETAPAITVVLPAGITAKLEIPVENAAAGIVAVLVKDDGTEEIVKTSVPTEDGVVLLVSNGDTVKIMYNAIDFVDVSDTYWGADAIDFVSSRGLFAGTSATTFSSEIAMTRAMILTVLARYEGMDTSVGSTWYEVGARWAMENGISDGTNLNDPVTREQLVTMLYRYVGEPAVTSDTSAFTDGGDVSTWASDAMTWAVQTGLIAGMGNNTLAPQGTATRAQVATILMRFISIVVMP